MIRFIIIIISISSFLYAGIILLIGNIKTKKLLKLLPKEKIGSFRIGTGYNNIKIYRYIISEDISDTQEIIKEKRLIRPIIKKLFISISIFFCLSGDSIFNRYFLSILNIPFEIPSCILISRKITLMGLMVFMNEFNPCIRNSLVRGAFPFYGH